MKYSSNNQLATRTSDVIVLAIKPKQTKDVLEEIKSELVAGRHIVVSVVTGVSIAEMQEVTGKYSRNCTTSTASIHPPRTMDVA